MDQNHFGEAEAVILNLSNSIINYSKGVGGVIINLFFICIK